MLIPTAFFGICMAACHRSLLQLQIAAGVVAALACAASVSAATLEVSVQDAHGDPLERVAVYVTAEGRVEGIAASIAEPSTAIMNQQNHEFVPHILVIESGTAVLFPNSDPVSHHVYSFSESKAFELGLYKGNVHPPLVFDRPGVVVLGCNIHDGMLGFILVVDTPHFELTDEQGVAKIGGLPAGDYSVAAWTPRARSSSLPRAASISLEADSQRVLTLKLEAKLAPDHQDKGASLPWERY
jgi:plastocyanin